MTHLIKLAFTASLVLCIAASAIAQQDAMFTKYIFNSLAYNPAYAGSKDFMSMGALHRSQWVGIEGAPTTQTFTAHTPLRNERVGVGFALSNDVIGPTNTFGANFSYAYRIPVGDGLRLSVGMQGGLENWSADWGKLNIENPDNAFDMSPSRWLPNFGAGLFLFSDRFYAGFSSPNLIEYDLRQNDDPNVEIYSRRYRHYYGAVGAAFPIKGDDIIFKPSLLIKNVGLFSSLRKEEIAKTIGAPTEMDIDASFLFYNTFWVGASFRTALEAFDGRSSFDSADLWFSWNLDNGLRVGGAYDYPLTALNKSTAGAFELMLGYEMNFLTKRIVTPRYF
ncbi:MAG: type IX secretion system membrane protein PorP/SprF [Saprospiraceae bacterium]